MNHMWNDLKREKRHSFGKIWDHAVDCCGLPFLLSVVVGLSCGWLSSAFAQSDGVCAKVSLRLDQSAVMTRTAFRATLELSNHDPASELHSVKAQVEIRDVAGQNANSRFQIETQSLDNISRIDGS